MNPIIYLGCAFMGEEPYAPGELANMANWLPCGCANCRCCGGGAATNDGFESSMSRSAEGDLAVCCEDETLGGVAAAGEDESMWLGVAARGCGAGGSSGLGTSS